MFGPESQSRPASGMPSTGSSLIEMPGSSRPTVPSRPCVAELTATTGAASVMPKPSTISAPKRSRQTRRVSGRTGSAPATIIRTLAKSSSLAARA